MNNRQLKKIEAATHNIKYNAQKRIEQRMEQMRKEMQAEIAKVNNK